MSARSRSGVRSPRVGAVIAGGALLAAMGLGVAPSQAAETPSPAPSPTTTGGDHATNPDFTPPEIVDTYVGQSVQARKNANGTQNAKIANFRWAVTQVNAESLNGLDAAVPLPMDDAPLLRSLTGRSNTPTQVEGGVVYDFDNVDGIQTKRTLNLWPQDRELPVDVTAEFTLNGEKVNAEDIVGAGGLVTATYTIVNKSVKSEDVNFTNVKGDDDTEDVETSQAFVGISKQFIPQSWAQFDPGHGIFGADGRGNYQTQWITLAFLPFAENGEASFGWSAVIPDGAGFIPKMVIEVSPLYVPAHKPEEEEETAESSNGVPRPNLDSATASVQSGVEDLVAGVSSLADTIGAATGATKEGLQIAVSQIKAAVADLCKPELLDCATEEDPIDLNAIIGSLKTASENLAAAIATLEASGGDATDLINTIEGIKTDLGKIQTAVTAAVAATKATISIVCPGPAPGAEDPAACAEANKTLGSLNTIDTLLTGILGALSGLQEDLPGLVGGIQAGLLTQVKATIDGLVTSLTDLQTYLGELKVPLTALSEGINSIGAAIDAGGAILGDVGSSLDQISSGKAQISGGLGQAGDQVSAYIADVVAVAQAAAAEGKEVAAELEAHANEIKAQLAGLKGRMAESPLPYSGGFNTAYAPAGDPQAVQDAAVAMLPNDTPEKETDGVVHTAELFGAYQFMLDPADSNKPNTPWRILLAVIFVVGAGFLAKRVANRSKA